MRPVRRRIAGAESEKAGNPHCRVIGGCRLASRKAHCLSEVSCADAANSSMPTSFAIRQGIPHQFARQSAAFPISRISIRRAIGYIGERANGNPFAHTKPGGPTPSVSHASGSPKATTPWILSPDNSICNASPAFPLPMRSRLTRLRRGGSTMKRHREDVERQSQLGLCLGCSGRSRGRRTLHHSAPGTHLDTPQPTKKAATAERFFAAIHRAASGWEWNVK